MTFAHHIYVDVMRKNLEVQRSASWETRPKGGYFQLVYIYIYSLK